MKTKILAYLILALIFTLLFFFGLRFTQVMIIAILLACVDTLYSWDKDL